VHGYTLSWHGSIQLKGIKRTHTAASASGVLIGLTMFRTFRGDPSSSTAATVGRPNSSFSGRSAALTLPMQVSGNQMRYKATMGTKAMTRMTEDHQRHRFDAV
jgi:hypothetical protein